MGLCSLKTRFLTTRVITNQEGIRIDFSPTFHEHIFKIYCSNLYLNPEHVYALPHFDLILLQLWSTVHYMIER